MSDGGDDVSHDAHDSPDSHLFHDKAFYTTASPSTPSHGHSSQSQGVPCPDPSVHERNDKHDRLAAQASTAALYVTQPHRSTDTRESKEDILGKDGKLSSKSELKFPIAMSAPSMATDRPRPGAATSLKHAKATDLPSFPSNGNTLGAAGAAAMLAKDYKMKDLWQPETSLAGSKAAAKAQKDGANVDLWKYNGSQNGLSAAALAMRKNTQKSLSPQIDRGYTATGKNNSMLAATQSARSGRQRADSTPVRPPPSYPDAKNSAANALSAATVSHRNSVRAPPPSQDGWSSEANQAARIRNGHMDKSLFSDNPVIGPEAEQRKHDAALRASAVSMAKGIMEAQDRHALTGIDHSNIGAAGAETAHKRNISAMSQPDLKVEAMKYIALQEQAQKLAQERLAKVDKDMENSKYREYYGYGDKQTSPRKSRLSVRGRNRGRAASEGANSDDSDDEVQARRIRRQMSQLNTNADTVSDKQRDDDRARLMKAAEKRVHDRMHDMDEKMFQETGKPTQSMMDDWEAKAREKAEQNRTEREKHPGKTHIGGGKYMDQSEIEAIAAARLKPTLDELNDTALKKRERDEEMAKQRDAQQTERMEERMRSDNQKAEFKRMKDQDKANARKEKEQRKAAEREEKTRKSMEQRKSREIKRETAPPVMAGTSSSDNTRDVNEPTDTPKDDTKTKRKSMFGRITDKLRSDKPAAQAEKPDEKTAADVEEKRDTDSSEPARNSSTATGLGAVASHETDSVGAESVKDIPAPDMASSRNVDSLDDRSRTELDDTRSQNPSYTASSAAAVATAGGAGAGGLAWATSRNSDGDRASSVSSYSTEARQDLERAETAHSFQPLASPPVEGARPNLERHITTISTSSEGSGSDDLMDSSDDEREARSRAPVVVTTSRSEEPAHEASVSPLREEERAPLYAPLGVAREPSPTPGPLALNPPASSAEPSAASESAARAEPAVIEPRIETPPASEPKSEEPAASAPVVATGPSTSSGKPADPKPEKEKRGLRGLISRLKGGDSASSNATKSESSRLQKSRSPPAEKGSSFQGGAKFTGAGPKDEGDITSAGREAESSGKSIPAANSTTNGGDQATVPAHIGTDGPIGGATTTRSESVSSFQRHAAPTKNQDLDAVSSSGDEADDELSRGRGGKGVGSEDSGQQFEEARDHFDEGLAPPPAFAGQRKSLTSSPVRETRFKEAF